MKTLALLAVVCLLFGCSVEKRFTKRLSKYCPLCPTENKDSVVYRDTVINTYWDSVIFVTLPPDTVEIEKYIKTSSLLYLDTMTQRSGIIEAQGWINANKLGIRAYLVDSSLIDTVMGLKREIKSLKEVISKSEKVIITPPEIHGKKWHKWVAWMAIVIAILLGGRYVYNYARFKNIFHNN
ncbi:MAG: hypothetical protein GY861_29340 [bacterium]|nr:hypothetical protein [bacterium]